MKINGNKLEVDHIGNIFEEAISGDSKDAYSQVSEVMGFIESQTERANDAEKLKVHKLVKKF